MNKQQNLVAFESARKIENLIPPKESNSFYDIGDGRINLYVIRDGINDYRFNLFTDSGIIYSGAGNFIVSGDIIDIDNPYNDFTIIQNTKLIVNNILTISKGNMNVYGSLSLSQGSLLHITDNGNVVLHTDSILSINDHTDINIENGSKLTIYGRIDIHISKVRELLDNENIIIDTAAVMNVSDILDTDRHYSLTDYDKLSRQNYINVNTQGEKNDSLYRIGYKWTAGNPKQPSQVLEMDLLWGEIVLGDFRLPILGMPETIHDNSQSISNLVIRENTTLYISESYKEDHYYYPQLYLGIIIGNTITPAKCDVYGTIIVDGINSSIIIDRGASLHIHESGELYLSNNATMYSTYNDNDQCLFIDGTLIIDDISQINTFNADNIVFGKNGKCIILNPDTGEKRILFSTPNGIKSSELYRIFENSIDQIEYHISNNTGISIDQYYENYSLEMTDWYGSRRIEKCIHDGLIVWHDGGFIELSHDIIPWVNNDCNLYHASRLFKTYGSYDSDKLQDAINRLQYVGCGNILFRFVDGNVSECMMNIESINMKNIVNNPLTDKYVLSTDNDGYLFLRNEITNMNIDQIINDQSDVYEIKNNTVEFELK